MKNKAFTLIELLAVIIILGILMLIAIPSVTNYINNSRKNTYVTTVSELVKGTIAKVNSGELSAYDTDTTYYVPATCIKLENGEAKSPYGKFDPAYVVVTFDGTNYNYYFTGKDVQNMGVPTLTSVDVLSKESIVANIQDIDTTVGIEGTSNIYVFSDECNGEGDTKPVGTTISGGDSSDNGSNEEEVEDPNIICIRATKLHTDKCEASFEGDYCSAVEGLNNTITYGSLWDGHSKIETGNAFDCDVDGTGYNKRFYYVSDYYNTHTKKFEKDTAVLVYESNTYYGVARNDHSRYSSSTDLESEGYECDENNGCNWYGPVFAIKYLPTTSQWTNVSLKETERTILAEYEDNHNVSYTPGGILPTNFSYEGYAARLLTAQEVMRACNMTKIQTGIRDSIGSKCNFLFENTAYAHYNNGNNIPDVLLETPSSNNRYIVYAISGRYRLITSKSAHDPYGGTRPVIEIPIKSIGS